MLFIPFQKYGDAHGEMLVSAMGGHEQGMAVLIVLSAVPVGTETLTHTSVELPDATVAVVVSGVVQVESRKLTGNVPPLDDMW